ncbi:MAG: preprotein translocase subunit SecG [Kiritimatiellaeota bacterium]|nr:preprotein translocase subunit SecG [Kiritimatiellota bacterium]
MNIVVILLYIVAVLSALLLIGIVLLQKSKDSGMVAMGGGMGEALFGAQVGNFLIKGTIVLGTVFLLAVLTLSVISSRADMGPSRVRSMPAPVEIPAAPVE